MIWITRLDGTRLLVNPDRVVCVEGGAESIVVLTTGERIRISEEVEEVLRRILEWRRGVSLSDWLTPETDD